MKKLLMGGVALVVLGVAPAAMAHSPSGSAEEHTFSCSAPDAEYPPSASQCQNGEATYTTGPTNDVRCADGGQDVNGTKVYGAPPGDDDGYLETCAEEGDVEGRAYVTGNENGISVTADGDKDNEAETQGWIRGTVGPSPSVVCGPDGSGMDSTHDAGASCG